MSLKRKVSDSNTGVDSAKGSVWLSRDEGHPMRLLLAGPVELKKDG